MERIKRLIAAEGSVVTWNERIPDPDAPTHPRQIDVTIRRDGRLTMVECRMRADPDDVTWIEELIGRRQSLRADAVIAVSASGFTDLAITKADVYGVILRNLATLSEPEIRSWGQGCAASLTYYEFRDAIITFTLPRNRFPSSIEVTTPDGRPMEFRGLFELVMRELEPRSILDHGWGEVELDFTANLIVGGLRPYACSVRARVRRIRRSVTLASVVAYAAVGSPSSETYARVQHFDEAFEVIDATEDVGVVVDLSNVPTPENCFFYGADFDFGRVVTMKWLKPIGFHHAMNFDGLIQMCIKGKG